MRAVAVLVATLLLLAGCVRVRPLRWFPPCADGLPPQILTDPGCPPDSICGYSCLPGRWDSVERGLQEP